MKNTILLKPVTFGVAISMAFAVVVSPVFADHHEEDAMTHDEHESMSVDVSAVLAGGGSLEQLQALVAVLQQLITLLQVQVEVSGGHMDDTDDHADDDDHAHGDEVTDTLAVWIEIHSNKTHAHVQEPGKELLTFFLEDLLYTEEEAIIDAIADMTGLDAHEIEEVITFPSGVVDENGDSVDEDGDEDHGDSDSLDGIHIMSDGTVMLGSGTPLDTATVTVDGMIKLEDGTLVEPAFDLRS